MKKEEKSAFAKASADKGKNLEDLEKQVDECQKKRDEYLAGWQRARADFLNYKKEEIERFGDILKYANVDLIMKILPALDNFDLAEKKLRSTKSEDTKIEEVINGFLQIKIQLQDFLKNQGVEEIKSLGEKFDPNFHEVTEEVEVKDKKSGIIIEEIKKGYTLHGNIIRPARVKVAK